jgi:GNAT superfamily N-acetyltransferase
MLDAYAEFWWSIYKDMPYVHRPDGGQTLNTPPISPEYFIKHLKAGFSSAWYFPKGNITDDSVIIVEDEGKTSGILVSSIDHEKLTGNILSCYVQRNQRGRELAASLLSESLERFRKMGLYRVVAAPDHKTMEVECPIHLALFNEGFGFNGIYSNECYGVFLGGSLEGFSLRPEIKEKIEQLRKDGITIERCVRGQFPNLRRLDTGEEKVLGHDECEFFAFVNGLAVGWTFEVSVFEDEGRILCQVGPEVIPSFRGRGIGKVLHHLGIEEAKKQGAEGGWTATGIDNPARFIYRSVGWQYWYMCFSDMSKQLR